jgi:hypothetical protein
MTQRWPLVRRSRALEEFGRLPGVVERGRVVLQSFLVDHQSVPVKMATTAVKTATNHCAMCPRHSLATLVVTRKLFLPALA